MVGHKDRDFYAEGVDAFCSGHSDIPPADVSEHGLDAEADWIDGYMSAEDDAEGDADDDDSADDDTDDAGDDPTINSL